MPIEKSSTAAKRRFCLVLVKPTHYCDDGYPIRWYRSLIPSNSLACLYGIVKDSSEQKGPADGRDRKSMPSTKPIRASASTRSRR